MNTRNTAIGAISLLGLTSLASASIGFEDLSFAAGNFENGANLTGSSSTTNDPFGPGTGSVVAKEGTYQSTGAFGTADFANNFSEKYDGADGTGNLEYSFWSGFAYSKDTDSVTPGFGNQYSARPGTGAGGSSNYGVAYKGFSDPYVSLSFTSAVDFSGLGLEIANTTYAYYSMLNGDSFSDAFTAGDYFKVTAEGFNGGSSTGTADYYLADFRSGNSGDHYIQTDWSFFSLDALGTVDEIRFTLDITDSGTPTYFAIDNVGVVPEPSAYALLTGILALSWCAIRRRS